MYFFILLDGDEEAMILPKILKAIVTVISAQVWKRGYFVQDGG